MPKLLLERSDTKQEVRSKVNAYTGELVLSTSAEDFDRPWGGFFVINEAETQLFIATFFPDLQAVDISQEGQRLSPKLLVVAPGKRLSWQYHYRRAELWKVIAGPVGIITSNTDEQANVQELSPDKTVQFAQEVRHRLIGLDEWGVVAEIWQHTNPQHPSDEADIVRVQDDFGR